MPDQPLDSMFRTAYQALLDEAPPAPEWDEVAQPVYRPVTTPRRRLPRWAGGVVVAGLLVGAVAGMAWLVSGNGTADPLEAQPPSVSEPTPTTIGSAPVDPADPVDGIRPITEFKPRLVDASSTLAGFRPEALVDGDAATAWNDDSRRGEGAWVRFRFASPFHLERIELVNLLDPAAFARNYRVAAYRLEGPGAPLLGEVADRGEPQPIRVEKLVQDITLHVTATHPAEDYQGQPAFDELAIAEVRFFGYPAAIEPGSAASPTLRSIRSTELDFVDSEGLAAVAATGGIWFTLVGDAGGEPGLWEWPGSGEWTQHEVPLRPEERLASVVATEGVTFATTSVRGAIEGGGTALLRRSAGPNGEWTRTATYSGWIGDPVRFEGTRLVAATYGGLPGAEAPELLLSDDDGGTWMKVPFEIAEIVTPQVRVVGLAQTGGRAVAIGRLRVDVPAVWFGSNPTGHWTRVIDDPGLARFGSISGVAHAGGRFVIVGTDAASEEALVGRSDDGRSWDVAALPVRDPAPGDQLAVFGLEAEGDLAVAYGTVQRGGETIGVVWSGVGDDWEVIGLAELVPVDIAVSPTTVLVAAADASGEAHIVWAAR